MGETQTNQHNVLSAMRMWAEGPERKELSGDGFQEALTLNGILSK